MQNLFELILGTGNAKKVVELRDLLRDDPVRLKTLNEFPNAIDVEETGTTFEENAILKATCQARALSAWVLAEDSGLGVDALAGRPGVYSARFAGPGATDQDNNDQLMRELKKVPLERRTAWYTCHACLSDPEGNVLISCQSLCYGRIVAEPRGVAGFGYDPYFEVPEYHLTFAELGLAVKSVISHRARAMRIFLREFRILMASLEESGRS